MSITIVRSFTVDPPTEMVCTDGEWTLSNDRLRIAAAGATAGEAMDHYVRAWSAAMSERIAEHVLRIIDKGVA